MKVPEMNKLQLERRLRRLEETVGVKTNLRESELPNDAFGIAVDVQTVYIQKLIERDDLEPELYNSIVSAARRAVRKLNSLGFDATLRLGKWMNTLTRYSEIGDEDCVSLMFKRDVSKSYATSKFQKHNMKIAQEVLDTEMKKVY